MSTSSAPPPVPGPTTASRRTRGHKPLRVLFIDHTAKLGGGEIALIHLLEALDRNTVEPILLTFEEGSMVERLRSSLEVHVLPLSEEVSMASKDALGWRSALQFGRVSAVLGHIWKVRQLIRSLHVDLVHTNSLKSDIIGGLAGRLALRPVIWHVRDRIAPDYLPSKVVHLFRALSRIVPTFLIAVSEATRRTLVSDVAASRKGARIAVVYDGVDLPAIAEASAPISADSPRIGLIGRICPWKGQHIFLQCAALLHPRFPGARFEIIGAPLFKEQIYEEELRTLSRTLGLDHVVTFTGFLQNVSGRVAELAIVVHASILAEPFGLVLIEGMAQSKPIVATRGGGPLEIVVDGETGLLVPMGDPGAMAEAIAALLSDPERARRMGQHGRQRVADHFTMDRTARDVEAIYRTLAGPPA